MSAKKKRRRTDFFQQMHHEAITDGGAIELGPVSPGQGALFERIRAGITPGEVMKNTFDEALKRRELMSSHFGQTFPPKVSSEVFDRDVERIKNFTPEEVENFDEEVCCARKEHRADGGGVYVDRPDGFGEDVFGFAYHAPTGLWAISNEFGIHGTVCEHLHLDIRYSSYLSDDQKKDVSLCDMLSGFIFQLPSFETPIMTPFGFANMKKEDLEKVLIEIWSWKMFIPVIVTQIRPRKSRWGELFTIEQANKLLRRQ